MYNRELEPEVFEGEDPNPYRAPQVARAGHIAYGIYPGYFPEMDAEITVTVDGDDILLAAYPGWAGDPQKRVKIPRNEAALRAVLEEYSVKPEDIDARKWADILGLPVTLPELADVEREVTVSLIRKTRDYFFWDCPIDIAMGEEYPYDVVGQVRPVTKRAIDYIGFGRVRVLSVERTPGEYGGTATLRLAIPAESMVRHNQRRIDA